MRVLIAAAAVVLSLGGTVPTRAVDYEREVKPILRDKCFACHGALKQEGSLRLDTAALSFAGGDSGPAIQPGDAASSLLIQRVTAADQSERMPQEAAPLSSEQIATLRRWIDGGAHAPADEQPESDPRRHWAFQVPARPDLPELDHHAWLTNPIDAFIAAEHQSRGLTPNLPAEPHVLLRRVYLDLIGLPPTREQLREFLDDPSERAYRDVVDRLLASPQYGERWGRHWMDVWRYSDWYGRRRVPDVLNSYGQIWRWRDWIVRSLNEDKGYDRMLMEMLAADEIAPADDENVVATGFIVRNFYRWNYNTWMMDTVEHTSKAFLALTMNCCHCHDHKYDPITNEEYFRFRAFFEPIEIRHDPFPGEPDPGPYPKYSYGASYKPITSGLVRIMDEKLDAKTFVYTGGEARNVIQGKAPVSPGAPAILGGDSLDIEPIPLPITSWYPGMKPFVVADAIAKAEADLADAQATLEKARRLVASAQDAAEGVAAERTLKVDQASVSRAEAALAAIKARAFADKIRYGLVSGDADAASRTASQAERQAALEASRVDLYRAERTLAEAQTKDASEATVQAEIKKAEADLAAARVDVDKAGKGMLKESTSYTPFSTTYPKQSTGRRAALASWLADEGNPLTARVAINHIWLRHFGRAIVESTENFGRSGAEPTHPRLLDWLAVELMENGWSMKHIHRLIVTSSAYRLSSAQHNSEHRLGNADGPHSAFPDPQSIDPDNVFLWRFHPRRMEAEVVRDSTLYLSGRLDQAIGGKEIGQELGQINPRRSVYFEHHGEGRMQLLDLFDAADPCDCYRRTSSVRPQQALALTNSELMIRQARLLARGLDAAADHLQSRDDTTFIQAAFEQILSRSPTPGELEASLAFLEQQAALFESASDAELSASASNDPVPPATDPGLRARENLAQALFSHHDFVTIR